MRAQTSSQAFSKLITAALAATIVGCHSSNNIPVPQPGAQLEGNPSVVTVTQKSGSVVTVYLPTIARDSIIGWLDQPRRDQPPRSRVAVSVSDIQQISPTSNTHGVARDVVGATGMIVLGVVFVAAIGILSLMSGY